MSIYCEPFGTLSDGRKAEKWVMKEDGAQVSLITYGAAIQSLVIPDREGKATDVVTGFDTAKEYEKSRLHFGATIGRCCNRIREGRFSIGGAGEYQLSINSPPHHIHGGFHGLDRKLWNAEIRGEALIMRCRCKDGEEGYPGNLDISLCFTFHMHTLRIQYSAISDRDTLCNLTNHTYFNLNGHGSGTILGHSVQIPADSYVPLDEEKLPLGYIRQVQGSLYDLRRKRPVSADGERPEPLSVCYLPEGKGMRTHGWLYGDKSRISLHIRSTMPALQYYTGYLIPKGTRGKEGMVYGPCEGSCLETQFVPDGVNHDAFIKPVLRRGEPYLQETQYLFYA